MPLRGTGFLDAIEDPRWARFLERAPRASIFHHPDWIELVRRQHPYPIAAQVVLDASGEVQAGLPVALIASRLTGRRLVALPFSDDCAVLVAPDADDRAPEELARALERLCRERHAPLEVRGPFPELATPVACFHRHRIDLSRGREETERGYSSQVRRNVRKARRVGVEVCRHTDVHGLQTFYALYLQTRQRLGVPTQPKRFVLGLHELFAKGRGFVSIARLEGEPAAAAVFLHDGGSLMYKYGASDLRFQNARPNNLLFADAIAWAHAEGLRELDLGRSDFDNEGLRKFKRSWGAKEEPLAFTYAGAGSASRHRKRRARILAPIIRRGPTATGRVIGELLYPHAG